MTNVLLAAPSFAACRCGRCGYGEAEASRSERGTGRRGDGRDGHSVSERAREREIKSKSESDRSTERERERKREKERERKRLNRERQRETHTERETDPLSERNARGNEARGRARATAQQHASHIRPAQVCRTTRRRGCGCSVEQLHGKTVTKARNDKLELSWRRAGGRAAHGTRKIKLLGLWACATAPQPCRWLRR